jgi:multiple sugar transport system permease protein
MSTLADRLAAPVMVRERSRPSALMRAFLWPGMTVMAVTALVPTVGALLTAFRNDELGLPGKFVGLRNFTALAQDPRFLNALKISFLWEVYTVLLTMIVAMVLAVFMFERTSGRLRTALSILLILPVLLPRVSAGFMWKFLLDPLFGLATWPERLMHGFAPDLVGSPALALVTVASVDVWQWSLFYAVILLKLMETLPPAPFEAARMDRARTWEVHGYVTLPMLATAIVSLTFVKAVESLRSFDLIYVMTHGGPGIATETLDMYAFSQGFVEAGRISYAAAMAVCLMIVTNIVFSLVWRRASR